MQDRLSKTGPFTAWFSRQDRPYCYVIGNEKGGVGKSTTALHLIVGLMRQGKKVSAIDLDGRQSTLTRMLENRKRFIDETGSDLPMPEHERVPISVQENVSDAERDEVSRLWRALQQLMQSKPDAIVIDTPGSDSRLSRLGHTLADTLVTPINDSFIDLDLLAQVEQDGQTIRTLSHYSQMVWEQRQMRANARGRAIDWVVMRNRLGHAPSHNHKQITALLDKLSDRLKFRLAPGFGERVIFRELFPKGLTLLDLRDVKGHNLSMSHVAARQEIRNMLDAIGNHDF